jgi:putative hydrolase of the HAD superfamily
MISPPFKPHTVTFDCWQTLIYEQRTGEGLASGRVAVLQEATGAAPSDISAAFANAWVAHQRAWHRQVAFNGPEITQHVLRELGHDAWDATKVTELTTVLEDELLGHDIRAIDGTVTLLAELRGAGVRTALICDTGFSPGRVVRQLLDRVGLLEHLEVQIFSDEIRAPKPHPLAFKSALEGLGVRADGAVHVGDLRRSDIAGARAAGMGTIRFRGRNDDGDAVAQTGSALLDCTNAGCDPVCVRPEADVVVSSYAELRDHLRASA